MAEGEPIAYPEPRIKMTGKCLPRLILERAKRGFSLKCRKMTEYETGTLLLILIVMLTLSIGTMELLWRRIMMK